MMEHDRGMTVREVAEVLQISEQTLRNNIRALFPQLMQNGVTTYLNEEQVTALKFEIEWHHNLSSIGQDRRMTVREVADILGVTDEAIKKHIRELWPDFMQERVTTFLNEEQITEIKRRMRLTTKVASAITDLETAEMLLKSAEHFKTRFEQEQELRKKAEKRLAIAELKAEFFDQVADSNDALPMRDVAAALNIPGLGRNKLFELLRKKGVLDNRNVPYREYQDRGYFRVIEPQWTDKEGDTHINLKSLVYQRGVDFIRKVLHQGGTA
jgi:phage antirepressor YoqD-like protein